MNPSVIGNRGDFWNNVKQSIYEAINEKRNAVQTAIKKKWVGKIKKIEISYLIVLYTLFISNINIVVIHTGLYMNAKKIKN